MIRLIDGAITAGFCDAVERLTLGLAKLFDGIVSGTLEIKTASFSRTEMATASMS